MHTTYFYFFNKKNQTSELCDCTAFLILDTIWDTCVMAALLFFLLICMTNTLILP